MKMTVNLTPSSPSSSTTSLNATYDLFSSLQSISEFSAINFLRSPVVNTCLVALTCFRQWAILFAIWMAEGNLPSGNNSFKFLLITVGLASFRTPVITTFVCWAVQRRLLPSTISSTTSWLCSPPASSTATTSSTSEKTTFTLVPQLKPFFLAWRQ